MSDLRERTIDIVKTYGLVHREEPFRLASGELSHDYMNGKKALAAGDRLKTACEAIVEMVAEQGVEFDAVGGLTLGADCYAYGIAMLTGKEWFVVRKQQKDHGAQKRVEGAELGPGVRVLLVDDVVTTAGSILQSLDVVQELGAEVVLAVTLVDRGDVGRIKFADRGIPYSPLLTYADLGIRPVGGAASA
ncbi:orotate phosphoribosyltransferase [Sporichthya brevicatena]|uniref:Orotate phosphoribosyltransferase n=1 Tax=Sporichthya brevicatena TaxID=171442 RepID=A0ABN1GN46_9ACTN